MLAFPSVSFSIPFHPTSSAFSYAGLFIPPALASILLCWLFLLSQSAFHSFRPCQHSPLLSFLSISFSIPFPPTSPAFSLAGFLFCLIQHSLPSTLTSIFLCWLFLLFHSFHSLRPSQHSPLLAFFLSHSAFHFLRPHHHSPLLPLLMSCSSFRSLRPYQLAFPSVSFRISFPPSFIQHSIPYAFTSLLLCWPLLAFHSLHLASILLCWPFLLSHSAFHSLRLHQHSPLLAFHFVSFSIPFSPPSPAFSFAGLSFSLIQHSIIPAFFFLCWPFFLLIQHSIPPPSPSFTFAGLSFSFNQHSIPFDLTSILPCRPFLPFHSTFHSLCLYQRSPLPAFHFVSNNIPVPHTNKIFSFHSFVSSSSVFQFFHYFF